jgi:hypothetical protein
LSRKPAREPHIVGRVTRPDLGDDLVVARERDPPRTCAPSRSVAERDRGADLSGEPVVPGGKLHVDDVILELALGGRGFPNTIAGLSIGVEPMIRKSMSPSPSRMAAGGGTKLIFGHTRLARATMASIAR